MSPFPTVFALPVAVPVWFLGLTVFIWLWLVYIRAATRFRLGRHIGKKQPQRQLFLTLLSAVFLLNVLFWPAALGRIALTMAKLGPLPGLGGDGRKHLIASVGAALLLAVFAAVVYLLWSGAGLVLASLRLWVRRLRCPACGEEVRHGFTLGKTCALCGEELAPWAFTGPPQEPGSPDVKDQSVRMNLRAPDTRQSTKEAWFELLTLALGLAGLIFFLMAGIYGGSLVIRWMREGTVPIGLFAPLIGLSLPGVALFAGAWALRFFVEKKQWNEQS